MILSLGFLLTLLARFEIKNKTDTKSLFKYRHTILCLALLCLRLSPERCYQRFSVHVIRRELNANGAIRGRVESLKKASLTRLFSQLSCFKRSREPFKLSREREREISESLNEIPETANTLQILQILQTRKRESEQMREKYSNFS